MITIIYRLRKDGTSAKTPTATSTTSPAALYKQLYDYDVASSNTYKRLRGGAPHNDREAGQINYLCAVLDTTMTLVFAKRLP